VNDIWVCDSCKSINRRRDDKCYHCRASRTAALETPGLDLRAEHAAAERSVSSYVISWPLALITAALLFAVAILGLLILKLTTASFADQKQAFMNALNGGHTAASSANVVPAVQLGLLSLLQGGLMLLAVLTLAGWLALVTRNVPLLGGGAPSRSPMRVFIYTLIPIWNFFKVPGMVQDLLYRVDPEGGGAFMVLAAVIGIVGSWVLSWFGGWMIGIAMFGNLVKAQSEDAAFAAFSSALDQSFWLQVVVELMAAAGTILLALIMLRVELRCAARDREIRAQMVASGAPALPTGPNWPTGQPVVTEASPPSSMLAPSSPVAPSGQPAAPTSQPGPSAYVGPSSTSTSSPYGPSSTTTSSPYGTPPGPPPPPPGAPIPD